MTEDLMITLVLLIGAGLALEIQGLGNQLFRAIGRGFHTIWSMDMVSALRSAISNPLLRLACILLLLIGTGWAATIAQMGVKETWRTIHLQRPTAQGARECHRQQMMAVLNIEVEAQTDEIPLAPGPLDPRFRYRCPSAGVFSFDESGMLRCSKHGSGLGNRLVTFLLAERNRP
jgi:hypothetical protein